MNSSDNSKVDTKDVQSLLLGASRARRVQHIFVRFSNNNNDLAAGAGRNFIRWIIDQVSWGDNKQKNEKFEIAIGISFRGLEALQVPDGYLHIFRHLAPAFAHGAAPRAAEHLGDVGESAASYWDKMFKPDQAHAVITIHGSPESDAEMKEWRGLEQVIESKLKNHGKDCFVTGVLHGQHLVPDTNDQWHESTEESFYDPVNQNTPSPVWVHFGYRDGLTSNRIRTQAISITANNIHEPGELLLGEPRNAGDNPWSLIDRSERVRIFFKHSSFGAMRFIEQDERGFRKQVEAWRDELSRNWNAPNILTSFVRAKLCGRWPNGQLLNPEDSPSKLPERPIERNNFDYGNENNLDENDTLGHGCPFASHIRRMNPRDAGSVQAHKRPIFRRGMPYGPWFQDDEPEHVERGLLGLFFCSDLRNQFEHLLGEWADRRPLGVEGDRHLKDPLIGAHDNTESTFIISRLLQKLLGKENIIQKEKLQNFKPFVRTRGTAYCFYPSNAALKELGDEKWIENKESQWLNR